MVRKLSITYVDAEENWNRPLRQETESHIRSDVRKWMEEDSESDRRSRRRLLNVRRTGDSAG
ncbi:hypothetical protein PI125_g12740 [Phytophthora idaei]|nr:hypothetical protein PI125_g12740 [Phytophthora idaei]